MSELLAQEFFAPADTDLIDTLIGQYRAELAKLDRICDVMTGDGMAGTMHYFIAGNGDERGRYALSVDKLFSRDGAVAALNAHYWRHAMELTDVLDCMPAKRREEWFAQITKMTTPDFEDATVRATLGDLLAQRVQHRTGVSFCWWRGILHTPGSGPLAVDRIPLFCRWPWAIC